MGIISQPRGLFPSYFSRISASLRASHARTHTHGSRNCTEGVFSFFTGPHLNYKAALNLCSVLPCVYVVTNDCHPLHFTVPPPTSPTTKSAGTPSEAGSQDSDGAVGPRCAHAHLFTHCFPRLESSKESQYLYRLISRWFCSGFTQCLYENNYRSIQ